MNPPESTASTVTIMVADDDEALREMLSAMLQEVGFVVRQAGDGQELRGMLEEAKHNEELPALVVSDHRMPRVTGLEVLSWVKQFAPSVPFVLMSAFAARTLHERARQLGAAAVLDKPVDLYEFRSFVVDFLVRPS